MWRHSFAFLLLPSVLVALSAGIGEARAEAGSASETVGLAKFEQGKKAYEGKDWAGALTAFQASLELLPSPNTRLYIARCQRELGRIASAHTTYELAIREAKDRIAVTGEKRYAATIEAATDESAQLAPRIPYLTIAVPEVVPDGLELQLDGKALARSAWGVAIAVDPGSHRVTASGRRLVPFNAEVKLGETEKRTVPILVKRVPTSVLVARFAMQPQGLALSVDGKPVELALAGKGLELDPGLHHLLARAPGYRDLAWDGRLEDGETKTLPLELEADVGAGGARGTPRWMFYSVVGAGTLTLAAAGYFALSARSLSNEQTALDPRVRDPAARDEVRALSTRANVLFVAGATLGIGAGVLFFTTAWGPRPEPSNHAVIRRTAGIVPVLSPSGGGLALGGTF